MAAAMRPSRPTTTAPAASPAPAGAALLVPLLLAAALSGCLAGVPPAGPADVGDGAAPGEVRYETVTERHVFEGRSSAGLHTSPSPVTDGWNVEVPADATEVHAELTWGLRTSSFGLEVHGPEGTHRVDAPDRATGPDRVTLEVAPVAAGMHRFAAVAEGPVVPDDLDLTVRVTRRVAVGASGEAAGATLTVRQESGRWVAELTYWTSGAADDRMDVAVDVANGDVVASGRGDGEDRVDLTVTAWARADTRDAAVDRVEQVRVTARVADGRIVARAEVPADGRGGEDWRDRGAHADVRVPTATVLDGTVGSSNGAVDLLDLRAGDLGVDTSNDPVTVRRVTADTLRLDTSNDPIDLDDVEAATLVAETSNDPITLAGVRANDATLDTSNDRVAGDIEARDRLVVDTSNDPVDLDVTPTGDLSLTVDASNADVRLGLRETADIAYEVDASVSNGRIAESMDEAHLEGDPEDRATLVTDGGGGRAHQVRGEVDTSNGDVRFEGL